MRFHVGHHNTGEIKKQKVVCPSFRGLKKVGLAKHLWLSQHGYAENSKLSGGKNAREVWTAVIEEGLYEYAQFTYS